MSQAFRKVSPTSFQGTVETHGDRTHLIQLVTTWGDTHNKDLHGQFFVKGVTDFGDRDVKTLKSFYEHLHNSDFNPYNEMTGHYLGPATLEKTDDMGRWFRFEIERSNEYHDYILRLNEMKLLGASTQAFRGGVEVDANGAILRWIESEVGPTPTPADPKTIGQVIEVAKSFNIEIPSHGVIVVTTNSQNDKTLPEQVEEILAATSTEEVSIAPDDSLNVEQSDDQATMVEIFAQRVEALFVQYLGRENAQIVTRLNSVEETLMAITKSLVELKQSQIVLARALAAKVSVEPQANVSAVEKAASLQAVQRVVYEAFAQFPPDAPGA